jgi:hypothetical protein
MVHLKGFAIAIVLALAPAAGMAADLGRAPAQPVSVGVRLHTFLDLFAGKRFWQGSFGVAGATPVVSVKGADVSYLGADRRQYPVDAVAITASELSFDVGATHLSLARLPDDEVEMTATRGTHTSRGVVLCKAGSSRCP